MSLSSTCGYGMRAADGANVLHGYDMMLWFMYRYYTHQVKQSLLPQYNFRQDHQKQHGHSCS